MRLGITPGIFQRAKDPQCCRYEWKTHLWLGTLQTVGVYLDVWYDAGEEFRACWIRSYSSKTIQPSRGL
jgi:hypothetical protein